MYMISFILALSVEWVAPVTFDLGWLAVVRVASNPDSSHQSRHVNSTTGFPRRKNGLVQRVISNEVRLVVFYQTGPTGILSEVHEHGKIILLSNPSEIHYAIT
jgi:hypothetical protein